MLLESQNRGPLLVNGSVNTITFFLKNKTIALKVKGLAVRWSEI
jgi:hypothetical protein